MSSCVQRFQRNLEVFKKCMKKIHQSHIFQEANQVSDWFINFWITLVLLLNLHFNINFGLNHPSCVTLECFDTCFRGNSCFWVLTSWHDLMSHLCCRHLLLFTSISLFCSPGSVHEISKMRNKIEFIPLLQNSAW